MKSLLTENFNNGTIALFRSSVISRALTIPQSYKVLQCFPGDIRPLQKLRAKFLQIIVLVCSNFSYVSIERQLNRGNYEHA